MRSAYYAPPDDSGRDRGTPSPAAVLGVVLVALFVLFGFVVLFVGLYLLTADPSAPPIIIPTTYGTS